MNPQAWFWLGLIAILGCGGPKLPTPVAATGEIQLSGQPLTGATIIFEGSGGKLAFGESGADGKFTLSCRLSATDNRPGALPGNYKVTIAKFVPPAGLSEAAYKEMVAKANAISETGRIPAPEEQPPAQIPLLPPKYSDVTKTTLSAKVEAQGKNHFQFTLEP